MIHTEKLLYIIADSKNEEDSCCKTVGRKLVETIMREKPDIIVEELDLYKDHIPRLKGCYFEGRSAIVNKESREKLTPEEQAEVKTIENLCDQFRDADIYVLAAPMWSMSFPAPVKEYLDCVVQADKTIEFADNKPHGLLSNKHRSFIYVQASGANIPWIIKPALNKGVNYVQDIIKFMGIESFEELPVSGTGTTVEEKNEAINKAESKIDTLVHKLFT